MDIFVFQKGFNYSQDGPGNRLVYHLQGCNMHCPWCANPEGMPVKPPLMQIHSPLPDYLCPYGAIVEGNLNRSVCIGCVKRDCVTVHRNTQLVCRCETMTVEQAAQYCLESAPMFFDGGGVTLTGGEVTVQFPAVKALLQQLHAAGIHTAIETNATHPELEQLFPLLDLLIADFKHYDSETLRHFTGLGNEEIIRNLHKAVCRKIPLWIRIPLIQGVNASPEDIPGFVSFFRKLAEDGKGFSVEFLRYHEYGKDKWKQCGWHYAIENGYVDNETVKAFEEAFCDAGLSVIRT